MSRVGAFPLVRSIAGVANNPCSFYSCHPRVAHATLFHTPPFSLCIIYSHLSWTRRLPPSALVARGPASGSDNAGSSSDPITGFCANTNVRIQFQATECNRPKKCSKLNGASNVNHSLPSNQDHQNMRWFPYMDQFRVKDSSVTSSEIIQMLGPFLSEKRKEKIERVAANRTYSVCPVVEGLIDLGNIAAVCRSADALGFQSVHVISNEPNKRYKKHRKVSMGSEKWLDAELWDTTRECLETLRMRGYRIAVTVVGDDTVSILDIDWTVPTAVVFGNEHSGVSIDAIQMSDIKCNIPMEGMVDSFNISVAAGIVMHHAVHDRIARLGRHGDLLQEEQKILSADFYLRHSSQTLNIIDRLLDKKEVENGMSLSSVLRGELEVDIENPDYLQKS